MRLLSMHVSRTNCRRLLVRRAPPTFGKTIAPGGNIWAPSSRATSLDTELAVLAIWRRLPGRFISETFAKRTSPRTSPWAEIGKPTPLQNQPTRFSGTTSQCSGTSPSHSTPESLYAGYGCNPVTPRRLPGSPRKQSARNSNGNPRTLSHFGPAVRSVMLTLHYVMYSIHFLPHR